MAVKISNKKLAIDKANAAVIVAVAAAVFIVIFSTVAGKALLDQRAYQSNVIGKKKATLKIVKKNIEEADKLDKAYREFTGSPQNILGGNPKGNGPKDGENARLVLDALPSKYDFPALTTSVEKLMKENNIQIESIGGKDDEISQGNNQASVNPTYVEVPFSFDVTTTDGSLKTVLELLEKSIRPIQIQSMNIVGGNGDTLKVTIEAKTFYQPVKKFDVKKEIVKRTGTSNTAGKGNQTKK